MNAVTIVPSRRAVVVGNLIWLASYPKSGNTWLRSFLHNLLLDLPESAEINELDRLCYGGSSRKWFEAVAPVPLEDLSPEALAALVPDVHAHMAKVSDKSRFVKTHNCFGNWFGVPLHTMALAAGAIYILRNPLDVAISLAHHYSEPVDWAIELMARPGAGTKLTDKHVPEVYDTWSAHVQSWTARPDRRVLVIRYEDLVAEPKIHFEKVARFLIPDPGEERLQRAIRNSSFDVLRAQEEATGFRERPEQSRFFFREGRAGQWRDAMTEEQIERVVAAHSEQMARFGYFPDRDEKNQRAVADDGPSAKF